MDCECDLIAQQTHHGKFSRSYGSSCAVAFPFPFPFPLVGQLIGSLSSTRISSSLSMLSELIEKERRVDTAQREAVCNVQASGVCGGEAWRRRVVGANACQDASR